MNRQFLIKDKLTLANMRWCVLIVAGFILIAFVVLMGLLRIALPYLTDYQDDIEEYLSAELAREVVVNKIDADWHWLSPRLKLLDVIVKNKDGKSILTRFDEVGFEFGFIKNLINFSFEPTVISLSGSQLNLKRDRQGRFFIQSNPVAIDLSGHQVDKTNVSAGIISQLNNKEIQLLDSTVLWLDEKHSKDVEVFRHVNSIVEISDRYYRLMIDVQTPQKIARSVLLKAEIDRTDDSAHQSTYYLKASDVKSDYLLQYLPNLGVTIDATASAELWMSLKGNQFDKVSGVIESDELLLQSGNIKTPRSWQAKKISTNFALRKKDNQWKLALDKLNMRLQKSRWKDVYFSVSYNTASSSLGLRCDYMQLEDLTGLALALPVDEAFKKMLLAYKPVGVMTQTDVYIDDWSVMDNWKLKTRFSDVGLMLSDYKMEMSGLKGKLHLEKDRAQLVLNSHAASFTSRFFNKPLAIESITADVDFHLGRDVKIVESKNIAAEVDGVKASARFKYSMGKEKILDFQLESDGASAQWVNQHKTDYFFGKGVVNWLSGALIKADFENVKLAFHGEVNGFPFIKDDGVVQSSFDINNAVLKYQPDWPEINQLNARFIYDNNVIVISNASGKVFNSDIAQAETTINLLGEPHVVVTGRVDTHSNELDKFFKQSPLKTDYLKLIDPLEIDAKVNTHLKIDIPLVNKPVNVSGKASVTNGVLSVRQPHYKVTEINGDFLFDNATISSDKVTGLFASNPVIGSVKTMPFQSTDVTVIEADFSSGINELVPFDLSLSHLYKNKTGWNMKLALMHGPLNEQPGLQLKLSSQLSGMALRLPGDLSKPDNKRADFQFVFSDYPEYSDLLAQYDEKINLQMRWNASFQKMRSDIRIYDGMPGELKEGINVSANLDVFDFRQWEKLFVPLLNKTKKQSTAVSVNGIKLKAKQFVIDDYVFDAVTLHGKMIDQQWLVDVNTDIFFGEIRFSDEFNKDSPVYVQFEKLDLTPLINDDKEENKSQAKMSPAELPPFKVSGKNLTYKNFHFNSMNLETSRSRYGLTVHALDLKADDLSVQMKGNWFRKNLSDDHSSFRVELNSNDVGAMLASFKLTESLKEGKGSAIVDWQWSASPFDFDWNLVSGNLQLDIEDGRFIDVEPGAGRVLGMFSLSSLPKRFMLDFSDTFTEGYEFNELSSKANFIDGSLYTNKTEISGSSADIYFNGRIGLADKDYDQVMSVVPRISSGVSGWIAVLQGAAVGLTAYLGQKILGVDEAAKNQYHITGSWSEPVIKKMGDKDKEKASTTGEGEE